MQIVLLSGGASVGKTAVLNWLIPLMTEKNMKPSVCKIDCFNTNEGFKLDVPFIFGASNDICPDHFLVSNLPDLWKWSMEQGSDRLLIETAGLCHRCSPATKKMLAGCVIDCTLSIKAPEHLGPMLLCADFIIITKIDMVSQAEREIILWKLKKLNPNAKIFPVDALAGYGIESIYEYIKGEKTIEAYEDDRLRHTMPMGVCSYCVGEKRVGEKYQQGVVGKIIF